LKLEDREKYELYSLANKMPGEFLETFKRNPRGVADFLRTAREAGIRSDRDWAKLKEEARRIRTHGEEDGA
jgi:hypothetical protein